MKFKKGYGAEFLRAIKLEGPKKRVVRSKQSKVDTDKQVLIYRFKIDNLISDDWDIDSCSYVNEYGDLMLNEECYNTLKIPNSLCPFVLFSFRKHTSVISNYRYDFGSKLLKFLGVNTKFGVPTEYGFKLAYEEHLKSRWFILGELSYPINYKINMYGHEITKKEKAIF